MWPEAVTRGRVSERRLDRQGSTAASAIAHAWVHPPWDGDRLRAVKDVVRASRASTAVSCMSTLFCNLTRAGSILVRSVGSASTKQLYAASPDTSALRNSEELSHMNAALW